MCTYFTHSKLFLGKKLQKRTSHKTVSPNPLNKVLFFEISDSLFFIENSDKVAVSTLAFCCLESAAKHNPQKLVFFLRTSVGLTGNLILNQLDQSCRLANGTSLRGHNTTLPNYSKTTAKLFNQDNFLLQYTGLLGERIILCIWRSYSSLKKRLTTTAKGSLNFGSFSTIAMAALSLSLSLSLFLWPSLLRLILTGFTFFANLPLSLIYQY